MCKKGLFETLKVTLAMDHTKTKDAETLKTAFCPKVIHSTTYNHFRTHYVETDFIHLSTCRRDCSKENCSALVRFNLTS